MGEIARVGNTLSMECAGWFTSYITQTEKFREVELVEWKRIF